MAAMQFDGEEQFQAPREAVFAALVDLDALAAALPDAVSTERVDAQTLAAVVKPGFSFLRGTMKLRITIEEQTPPESARMRIEASGIGVSMTVVSQSNLEPTSDGTKVAWHSEVTQMKGLVATISPGLIRAAADQVVRDGWKQLRERVESNPK